ncbi:unnamed protein product [Zymoseptoria tritici ST99CH_3D7]|uniref:Uncharacterized protein n=1 Tax=Zymoseptoria tritici (strain ST99CH_3D7) TaxID=1276538 RepID=A0A1X7S7V0_ZYMT9|nr:unnamed protein product [Zymoseptoria tritici ST99CH_3D7]
MGTLQSQATGSVVAHAIERIRYRRTQLAFVKRTVLCQVILPQKSPFWRTPLDISPEPVVHFSSWANFFLP